MPAREYGPPPQVKNPNRDDYLEVMTKSVFQTGISWDVVNKKWPGIRDAFHGFDAERVASLSPEELDELQQDTRVIRNRRKLEAIAGNAQVVLDLTAEHGSFKKYLAAQGDFDGKVAALKRDFKFLGDTGSYVFLYVVGEEVPPHDEWEASRPKRKR
jgi:3-methyladenine DNA glycosylase Tag